MDPPPRFTPLSVVILVYRTSRMFWIAGLGELQGWMLADLTDESSFISD